MKPEQQIKAIAELDGWKHIDHGKYGIIVRKEEHHLASDVPDYLTSRDAIIPVIEKQEGFVKLKVHLLLSESCLSHNYLATPSQLCEALLRATGKWG